MRIKYRSFGLVLKTSVFCGTISASARLCPTLGALWQKAHVPFKQPFNHCSCDVDFWRLPSCTQPLTSSSVAEGDATNGGIILPCAHMTGTRIGRLIFQLNTLLYNAVWLWMETGSVNSKRRRDGDGRAQLYSAAKEGADPRADCLYSRTAQPCRGLKGLR